VNKPVLRSDSDREPALLLDGERVIGGRPFPPLLSMPAYHVDKRTQSGGQPFVLVICHLGEYDRLILIPWKGDQFPFVQLGFHRDPGQVGDAKAHHDTLFDRFNVPKLDFMSRMY
jgi:hypothetical protein